MSDEKLIAEAILQLKQDSNILKDYMFPIAMALFSSFIGALVGYFVYLRQERLANEKKKFDIINKWILLGNEIQQDLTAIKVNYFKQLDNDPFNRAFSIPTMILNPQKYNLEYQELAFIEDKYPSKFSHIPYLRTLFGNYLNTLSIWDKRNQLNDEIKSQIIMHIPNNSTYYDVERNLINSLVDQSKLAALIDLTETVIRYTDDLIIEFEDFINEIPEISKKIIDTKLLKNYGKILEYGNMLNNELILECQLPDYKKLSLMLGRPEQEIMARYSPLFKDHE